MLDLDHQDSQLITFISRRCLCRLADLSRSRGLAHVRASVLVTLLLLPHYQALKPGSSSLFFFLFFLYTVGEIFGTFNASSATPAEKTLSHTIQTAWANFIKNPKTPPAPNWERFLPGNTSNNTLAKLAFNGNVQLSNLVQPSPGNLDDGPCDQLWNAILTF